MKLFLNFLSCICLCTLFFCTSLKGQLPAARQISPSKILIVYNESDADSNGNGIPDSKETALYYKTKRHVPDSNMLGLKINQNDGYYHLSGWRKFWDEMVVPIRAKIKALGDTNIYYIVMADRLPYYLWDDSTIASGLIQGRSIDNMLAALNNLGTRKLPDYQSYWKTNPLYETTVTKGKDFGPFNHKTFKLNNTNMYLVTRLVAPTLQMNNNLVDMALYGEKYIYNAKGYYCGISYADNRVLDNATILKGYPYTPSSYTEFDQNAGYIYKFYQKKKLKYKYEATYAEIGGSGAEYTDTTSADSAPHAMLYGGWYNYGKYNNVWTWIPGSVACDLNSNSASGIRSAVNNAFISGAIQNGLTCGSGVIFEPYLNGHSQPDVLLYYLLNGYNFIESTYHAEPGLMWQGEVVGDPLYNPFKVNKPAIRDSVIQPIRLSIKYKNDSDVSIHADFNCTEAAPEVVKARIVYGYGTNGYTDTIPYSKLYFAHHIFHLQNLVKKASYHFIICVTDPSGNSWCSKPYRFNADSTVDNITKAAFIASDTAVCPGTSIYFENISSGPLKYTWTLNGKAIDTTENLTITLPKGKNIIGLVVNGKDSAFRTIMVGIIKPTISLIGNVLSTKPGMATYQWLRNGVVLAGANGDSLVADSNGYYSIIESNTLGCTDTSATLKVIVFTPNTFTPYTEFAPRSAIWYYETSDSSGKQISYSTLSYSRDTIIKTKMCKVLTELYYNTVRKVIATNTYNIHQDSTLISIWNDSIFTSLYSFVPYYVSDTLRYIDKLNGEVDYVVDTMGSILISKFKRRVYYDFEVIKSTSMKTHTIIFEGIGNTSGFTPFTDPKYPRTVALRCYSDSALNYKASSSPCDTTYSIFTGTELPQIENGEWNISPNPFYSILKLHYNGKNMPSGSKIEILSITGQNIYRGILSTQNDKEINLNNLSQGIYILKIISPEKEEVFKIIKE
jgi:uncharacterized protein (TIGR03790 family)